MTPRHLYMDHNATTPVAPEVVAAMAMAMEHAAGNPSSVTRPGRAARKVIEESREEVARLLGCRPAEVVFTSGGTESINMALIATARARRDRGRHLVTAATEHPATLGAVRYLVEAEGFEATVLPVDGGGRIRLEELEGALRPDTNLVSVMLANNETGTLQPVPEVARQARRLGIAVHTDAVQAIGKVPVSLEELEVDLLSIAGHKFHAPKGVGALYVREGVPGPRLMYGGHQERDIRPGTENVPGIAGLGVACRLAREFLGSEGPARLAAVRERLWTGLQRIVPGAVRNGHPGHTLPNTLHVSFPGLDGESLVAALDLEGVSVSAGSACASGARQMSHVLEAMGVAREMGLGSLRISLGRTAAGDDVEGFLEVFERVVARFAA